MEYDYRSLKKYIFNNYPERVGELLEYIDSEEFEVDLEEIVNKQYKFGEHIDVQLASECTVDAYADNLHYYE